MAKKKKKKVAVSRGKNVLVTKSNVKKKDSGSTSAMNVLVSADGKFLGPLGSFAGVTFIVATQKGYKKKVLSPQNMQREVGSRWASHEVIGGDKPQMEFLGADIDTMTFTITVDVMLGYKPHAVMKKLNDFLRKGKVDYFYLGNHKLGTGRWKLEKISESFNLIYAKGELARATLDITISEYF